MTEQKPMQRTFVRAALVAGGVFYLFTGLALLFAPEWFYNNVGTFPPYNRHYEGDLGALLLPLGITLLVASRDPARHRLLIGFAALGSLIHAVNHIYDDLMGNSLVGAAIMQTLPLLIFGLVMAAAWWFAVSTRP
jgi:hypothetical protein